MIIATLVVVGATVGAIWAAPALLGNKVSNTPHVETHIDQKIDTSSYTSITKTTSDMHRGNLILVNADHPYSFDEPTDIIPLADVLDIQTKDGGYYPAITNNASMERVAADALKPFLADALSAGAEKHLAIVSGYRDYESQVRVFGKIEEERGSDAGRWAAVPGTSEHHTGLAFDLSLTRGDFNGKGGQKWFLAHCDDYGFVVRYESSKEKVTKIANEPWHLRYVGQPHAKLMRAKHLCLEEYIDYLKGFPYTTKHLMVDGYEIYYVPANRTGQTNVPVPKSGPYDVSGNNVDGFIVTAKTSS